MNTSPSQNGGHEPFDWKQFFGYIIAAICVLFSLYLLGSPKDANAAGSFDTLTAAAQDIQKDACAAPTLEVVLYGLVPKGSREMRVHSARFHASHVAGTPCGLPPQAAARAVVRVVFNADLRDDQTNQSVFVPQWRGENWTRPRLFAFARTERTNLRRWAAVFLADPRVQREMAQLLSVRDTTAPASPSPQPPTYAPRPPPRQQAPTPHTGGTVGAPRPLLPLDME